jgi:transcriptional repressor NrdR
MKCMYCNATESRVIDSRPTDEGLAIRRRRECVNCGRRFTTYEKIENVQVMVVKKDGSREAFDADKIRRGLIKACEKRPVAANDVDALVRDVEQQILNSLDQEVSSAKIGEMVMERLRTLDEVAYVRFASVYRSFCDINTFMEELKSLLGKPGA